MFKDTPAARALITYLASPEAATIWAMSSNFGGEGDIAARASRNMVLQNGQAAATVPAPVAASSRARL